MVQSTKVRVYALVSGVRLTGRMPSLHARTKVERVRISWGYSCRTVIQRTALCMSNAIIRGVVRCFSMISEVDEEFGSLMLMIAW